ncbi:MAG: hypothetical protein JNK79_11750 [Chitinophagaceae bacterium]|nr:hypothetical protein [Chitinophagaceae bacterium]
MKTLGIVLIVIGVIMALTKGFSFVTEKEVADIGPLEINKKENKSVGWPTYAGVGVALVGVVLVVSSRKR